MSKVNIPTFKLNNGTEIPALGYGTWLGVDEQGRFQNEDTGKLVATMSHALDVGFRHIDTSHVYRVEPEVGQVVRQKIAEGVVKREDMFITTKVWNHNHREADAEASVQASLRRLGLDYVDLVLIHWPVSISEEGIDEKIDYLETWRGLEAAQRRGLARSIGVSNFNKYQMERLLSNCQIPPAVNQIEVNLTFGQSELVSFCQDRGVLVVGYTTFGRLLDSRASPETPEPKMNNTTMVAMASKYGKTVTQIVLRYLYQRGIATIPKTLSKERVVENASIFDFELDKDDTATLAKFDVGYRTVRPVCWQHYQNYPFEKVDEEVPEIPLALRKWKNGANLDID